ncbi:hypothetical protein Cantr_05722 [Candida viswanathii]|uniref:Uncharacterized protein n=1 Tax=Candida viswanathii TaxID=5486 RepID=A0A367XQ87_9ASCO|nr:hypothetical protein Cantr_05722 [Candida viswanathii]
MERKQAFIVLSLPIVFGSLLPSAGIKVEEVNDSEGWPWPVMQRPLKEGTSVTYDKFSGVYVKGADGAGLEDRDYCYGARIGNVCCIGIYCSDIVLHDAENKDETAVGITREKFSSQVDPTKVKQVVLHSDGSTDIQYISSGNIDGVCVGVRLGGCCVGLCCGCLEVIGNGTSVDEPTSSREDYRRPPCSPIEAAAGACIPDLD